MKLEKILFLDIETAPQEATFNQMPEELASLWEEKVELLKRRIPERYLPESTAESHFEEAGIFAEFGRVVCISVGYIYKKEGELYFRVKSYYGENEKQLLHDFSELLERFAADQHSNICGHNIKEFDIPYIARRMLICGLPLPDMLNVAGKKPWECKFLDTMEMWKFGDFKHYTSLKLLCAVFNIPTPKDDIDGSQIAGVFYKEKNVERIAAYCEKDVIATMQVFLKLSGFPVIKQENIEHIS
jgi:DNA polymerase elongation subunit (family B)